MTDRREVDRLVDRFLAWPLPASVAADQCATNPNYPHQRSGTNLLSAAEARQMIEHLLAELPKATPTERQALIRRACDTCSPPSEAMTACDYPACGCQPGSAGITAVEALVDAGWRPASETVEECARAMCQQCADNEAVTFVATPHDGPGTGRYVHIRDPLKMTGLECDAAPIRAWAAEKAGAAEKGAGWRPMSEAPRRTPVLLLFKNPIPADDREDLRRFDGLQFVGRHVDDWCEWGFAAPVGMAGFPDEWFVGWQPLPPSSAAP